MLMLYEAKIEYVPHKAWSESSANLLEGKTSGINILFPAFRYPLP